MITALLLYLFASSTIKTTPSEADVRFHLWCEEVGIDATPSVQLITGRGVAGRGVFAVGNISEGETVVTIPPHSVLTSKIAAEYFPSVANDLRRRRRRSRSLFSRIFRRRNSKNSESDNWQTELTMYALAAVETEHPWAHWINEWQRDDPILKLFSSGVVSSDEETVSSVADELQEILPELNQLHIQAALQIRLQRFERQKKMYRLESESDEAKRDFAKMYSILGSRALDLGDDIIGVVPMYDMVNHSLDPNLGFGFDGQDFKLFALRDIKEEEELFLCYNEMKEIEERGWDEINSLWTLIQWGIPISTQSANEQLLKVRKRESVKNLLPLE